MERFNTVARIVAVGAILFSTHHVEKLVTADQEPLPYQVFLPLVSRNSFNLEPFQRLPQSVEEISRGNLEKEAIALTFDCGSSAQATPLILDTLRSKGVKSTFFVTGQFAQNFPQIVRQIAADGHEIGNHTFSHRDLTILSDEEIISELQSTEDLLFQLTDRPTLYMRFPFGARNERVKNVVTTAGWTNVFWTQVKTPYGWVTGDSGGWRLGSTPESVYRNMMVAARLGNGVITVQHCAAWSDARSLDRVLSDLQERGLTPTTVSQIVR